MDEKPRLIITRARGDAEAVAQTLSAPGFSSFCEPMLSILPEAGGEACVRALLRRGGWQALIATSRHAVAHFAAFSSERSLPLWTVGEATVETARACGFLQIEAGGGDVSRLLARLTEKLDPKKGGLLYLRGRHVTRDLAAELRGRGFAAEEASLYEAAAALSFSESYEALLKTGAPLAVLFFSRRSARIYADLCRKARAEARHRRMEAFCFSAGIAEEAGVLPWRRHLVASSPDLVSLVALLRSRFTEAEEIPIISS